MARKLRKLIANETSSFARYFDVCFQILRRPEDSGALLDAIQCPHKETRAGVEDLPDLKAPRRSVMILLNGVLNFHLDIEGLLRGLHSKLDRFTRVAVIAYNPYLRFLFSWATWLGIRSGEVPATFLTRTDLANICKLSGFEVVRLRHVGSPFHFLPVLGSLLEPLFKALPLLKHLCLVNVIVLRPVIPELSQPSLSVVIPARNEKGNLENALRQLSGWDACHLEVVIVEGNSTDGTWEEVERLEREYSGRINMKCAQQQGKGKADAVRLGFELSSGELLTVLDADLTMPPELLHRFYDAYRRGLADFINGSRLVYPMEGRAMPFANRLGNIFFAKALSYVLDVRIGDSLCGTKLLSRNDYKRVVAWRKDFGDFDPFGDFELLFPAAVMGLGILDVPIHYHSRSYGRSNIHPFRDGWILLRMTLVGLLRIKCRY